MMRILSQVWRVACFEGFTALRSRRAWVVLALYLAASLFTMNGTISALGKLESELTRVLQLPVAGKSVPGVVSKRVWSSETFQKGARRLFGDSLIYRDLAGKHPIELIYGWLCFFYAPLLVVLVSANRIPEDLHSGSVKYMLFRTSRGTWAAGKLLGQALLVAAALLSSAAGAYLLACWRVGGGMAGLLLPLLGWSVRAWFLSFAYLGAVMGLSLLTRSAGKATVMGIGAIAAFSLLSLVCRHFGGGTGLRAHLPMLLQLLPGGHQGELWRSSLRPLAMGCSYLFTLGLTYFTLGYLFFRGRDI